MAFDVSRGDCFFSEVHEEGYGFVVESDAVDLLLHEVAVAFVELVDPLGEVEVDLDADVFGLLAVEEDFSDLGEDGHDLDFEVFVFVREALEDAADDLEDGDLVSREYLRLDDEEVDDVHEVLESSVREDDVGVLERDLLEAADDCFGHVVVHELREEPVEALVFDQGASGFWRDF